MRQRHPGITGLSGKYLDKVYVYHRKTGKQVIRRLVTPQSTPQREKVNLLWKNVMSIKPSDGYRKDLKCYLKLRQKRNPRNPQYQISWYNLFVRMLFSMQKAMPDEVNLATLTREEIIERNLPCRTLRQAIEAGILPDIYGADDLTREI